MTTNEITVFLMGVLGIAQAFCLAMWAYHSWRLRKCKRELQEIEERLRVLIVGSALYKWYDPAIDDTAPVR